MKTNRKMGWIALCAWAALIIAGIVAKRIYGHPNWMVFFHLPAAVALVLAFRILSAPFRLLRARELGMRALEEERGQVRT
jgi:hypothetical protein